jgi:putative addiction module component (TIGR02574 family)
LNNRVKWIMAKDVTGLFRDASELSEHDRATLAGLLIESLEADSEPDVEASWSAEIERRVADIDSGNVQTIPWEEVRRRLLDRLNAR